MCGVAGYIHKDTCSEKCIEIETISHENQACRGPDNHNSWKFSKEDITVHLFHQRLRIQDLSPTADQPMHSKLPTNTHIVFNGEIYNAQEVRQRFIPNFKMETNSDTEVLLEALTTHKTHEVLNFARGMFAIGKYNSDLQTLELMRDYFGEKPMHYAFGDDYIVFASQFDTVADSIQKLQIDLELDQEAIYEYLIMGYFPLGSSLFKNVKKLHPGTTLQFDLKPKNGFVPSISRWAPKWKASEPITRNIAELENTLTLAVSEQLIGDVPIGVFLSGGVDSTLVSALAQKQNDQPIHSFSLGFSEEDFDESKSALKASKELGTQHHALQMNADDAAKILPEVLRAYPEPMGDPSVFPNTYLSREARKLVTVVLTGDGADELFFGYGRYSRFLEIKGFKSNHSLATKLLKVGTTLAIRLKFPPISRILRINEAVRENSDIGIYLSLVAFPHYKSASNPRLFEETLANLKLKISPNLKLSNPLNRLREVDVETYLADDILVKVDRAAMAFGLETRAPFLDRRVALLSSSATNDWLESGEQKHVLKEILSNYVSDDIFRRPKMGFGAPIGEWLRTSLADWGASLVTRFDWGKVGVNSEYVRNLWEENFRSEDKSATYLWILLSLAASVERYI